MAAEGLLDDPSLFAGAAALLQQRALQQLWPPMQPPAVRLGVLPQGDTHPSSSRSRSSGQVSPSKRVALMQRYMELCDIYPPPHSGCAKAHLFRCLHPILISNKHWRDALHQVRPIYVAATTKSLASEFQEGKGTQTRAFVVSLQLLLLLLLWLRVRCRVGAWRTCGPSCGP